MPETLRKEKATHVVIHAQLGQCKAELACLQAAVGTGGADREDNEEPFPGRGGAEMRTCAKTGTGNWGDCEGGVAAPVQSVTEERVDPVNGQDRGCATLKEQDASGEEPGARC